MQMDDELQKILKDFYASQATEAGEPENVGRALTVAEIHHQFCFELALVRLRRPMTQQQMAQKLSTTQSAISRLEGGFGNPNLNLLLRYCK